MKRKSIIVLATGDSSWIGGLYYKKNVLFILSQNEWIRENYKIIALTERENVPLFDELRDKVQIVSISSSKQDNKIFKIIFKIKLFSLALLYGAKYIYPFRGEKACKYLGIRDIMWIPDFQDRHYPEFFPENTLSARYNEVDHICKDSIPLVLSSNACRDDLFKYYGSKKEVYVLPFVSYIEKEVRALKDSYVEAVLKEYSLAGCKYVIICNQFWPHKNHRIVCEALEYIEKKGLEFDYKIVFTGRLPKGETVEEKKLLDLVNLFLDEDRIIVLGYVDRLVQLALMKGAMFILQPSLFEGWGTVLEDAKVLDKTVVLSDIPVHREQKSDKCILFDPFSPEELAKVLIRESGVNRTESTEAGIQDMYVRAKKYSSGFEKLIKDYEKKMVKR